MVAIWSGWVNFFPAIRVNYSPAVTIVSDDNLKISSKNDEIGNLEENIFIELEGSNLEIAFNAKYFMDALKTIDEEYISLELNTNVSPCILKPYDDDSYTYLLLPVRI